jgi:LCP family protein required for cell wall assembly
MVHRADTTAEGRRRSPLAVVLLTILGAIIPGSGLIAAGRVKSGITVLVAAVAAVVGLVLYVGTDVSHLLAKALNEQALRRGAIAAIVLAVAWSAVTIISHRALRPGSAGSGERIGGSILVGVLCLGISTPLVLGANVLLTTRTTLHTIFRQTQESSALGTSNGLVTSTPTPTTASPGATHPPKPAGYTWARRRLNILLLGSDAASDRTGTRTDSMVIASIDTVTGKVMIISIPRNLCRLDWNPTSPLGQLYPDGWTQSGGDCDTSGNGDDIINAIYNDVPIENPGILGKTANEGADALSLGLQYSLGVKIDYYLLVNLDAFETIVNAIGGVTVNINTPIPVGGQHDANGNVTAYPTRWLMPGPNQHLDGKNALWYARGRFYSDDYDRIDRQKCMINAITTQADPTKVLTSYVSLATTLQNDVLTDIPENLLNPLAQLALKVKDVKKISSITIDEMSIPAMQSSNYPVWTAARDAVAEAIASTDPTTTSSSSTPTTSATGPTTPATPKPAPSVTATTSNGSSVTTNVGAGCGYNAVTAKANIATWEGVYGGMYDNTGHPR